MTDPPIEPPAESPTAEGPTAAAPHVPTKDDLRRRIRAARRAAQPDPQRAQRLASAVMVHPEVAARLREPGALVALYVSLPWEPPTAVLRDHLRGAGVDVLLPVADPHGGLSWVVDDGTAGAAWGVPGQPATPPGGLGPVREATGCTVVLAPALAATADGRRLGQGGGYYDRYLATLPSAGVGGPLVVALVGPSEVVADLPTEPHDRRVDVVIVG